MKSLLALLACLWTMTAGSVELRRETAVIDPTPWVEILEDREGRLSREQLDHPQVAATFKPPPAVGLNFGFTESTYWVRVSLKRSADAPKHWLLVVPYALIDEITLHTPDRDAMATGARLPVSSRPVFHRHFVFPLEPATEDSIIYLRIRSANSLKLPLELWQVPAFNWQLQRGLVVQGVYFGGVLTLVLYNLSLFLSMRDRRFLHYLLCACAMGIGMLAGNGFGRQFFWTESPAFDVVSQGFFLGLAACFGVMFTRSLLQVSNWSSRLARWLQLCIGLNILGAFALIIGASTGALRLPTWLTFSVFLLQGLALVLILSAAVLAVRVRRPHAKSFLLAWGAICLGGFIATGHMLGWLPDNGVTAYALQIGSSVEMLLLALVLSDTVRGEHASRVAAQAELIETRRLSENRLGAVVSERTRALGDALLRAESAATEQRQLLSMASHEFRTPAAIIKASVDSLQWLRDSLSPEVLRRLDNIRAASQRLQGLANDFIDQDRLEIGSLQPKLAPLDVGRLARDVVQAYGSGAGILMDSRRRESSRLMIQGDSALLGIAMRNLIDNALRHNPPGAPPAVLSVSADLTGARPVIRLRVADHGPGVADSDKLEIFERYVSGQPGPAHSGLGLSIVRRVAFLHGGEVRVIDGTPRGAVFELDLPLATTV